MAPIENIPDELHRVRELVQTELWRALDAEEDAFRVGWLLGLLRWTIDPTTGAVCDENGQEVKR